jgi:hypothetical protein
LPPPIIGGIRFYAKPHTAKMGFGFNFECSTKIIKVPKKALLLF